MRSSPIRRRAPRPVADAPVAALVEGAEELAKAWLVALVEQEPLARAPSISTGELAREGPAICAALARALGSDTELAGLEERCSGVGELAGAKTPDTASRAVEALRAVLWSALLSSLSDPDAMLVAELAERLALVCEVVRGSVLRRLAGAAGWSQALEAAVARARRDGTELSLLVVEVDDGTEALGPMVRRAAGGLAEVVQDGARAWMVAPGVDRVRAGELASAVAAAVRDSGSPHGVPLKATIGVAALGVDAGDAAGLIGAAEEAAFAAAARGIEVARAGEPG